ncbi:MAG: LytS/YhcK type 5TM receptor domain-containing protein [Candidatus Bathyarchaeia archaeon]
MKTKTIAFITMMGALGNILFVISNYLGPIVPGVSIDLSHIPTFIAAIYGGPLIGFLTGLIAGILPGIYYGPLGAGSWVGLIGLPIGKSIAGISAGLLFKNVGMKQRNKSLLAVPLILISYVPECIYTILYFIALLPFFVGSGGAGLLIFVLPKAWAEIIFIGFFIAALVGNTGFNSFLADFFGFQNITLDNEKGKQ